MKLHFLLGKTVIVIVHSYVRNFNNFFSVEWEELWDEESAHMYADIIETADVLEQIHQRFAGMSNRWHPLYAYTAVYC